MHHILNVPNYHQAGVKLRSVNKSGVHFCVHIVRAEIICKPRTVALECILKCTMFTVWSTGVLTLARFHSVFSSGTIAQVPTHFCVPEIYVRTHAHIIADQHTSLSAVGNLFVDDEDETDVWHDVDQIGGEALVQSAHTLLPEIRTGRLGLKQYYQNKRGSLKLLIFSS